MAYQGKTATVPRGIAGTRTKPPSESRRLNDLSTQEWLQLSRSAFIDGVSEPEASLDWDNLPGSFTVMSRPGPRDSKKKQHPATFPEEDARRLIRMFTQKGQTVLDPFIGTGSTAIASALEERACLGFELYSKWSQIAHERVVDTFGQQHHGIRIETADALTALKVMPSQSQDFILTSPPYWGILNKIDHKARAERQSEGLPTDYGNHQGDLSQIESYKEFLRTLAEHFRQWYRVLRNRAYAAVVVSDFRHRSKYYPFHAHIGQCLERVGMTLQGIIVVVQDWKRLYPYGYPTTYVSNICNQFVVIARKLS